MKILSNILILCVSTVLFSCNDMLDNIQPYLDRGETVYVGKADSISAISGRNRIKLEVFLKSGFSQSLCQVTRIDADGESAVEEIPVIRESGKQKLTMEFDNLKEGQHDFEVVLKDDAGNTSLIVPATGYSYGAFYESTLMNRRYSSVSLEDDIMTINWKSIERAEYTVLNYTDIEGEISSVQISPDEMTTVIDDATLGSEFTWSTYYKPTENSLDVFKSGDATGNFPLFAYEHVDPYYFLDFEGDLGGSRIKGAGRIEDCGDAHGKVFSNAKGGVRSNYLILPDGIFNEAADTRALTVSFWVNRGNEVQSGDYAWGPIFSGYGGDTNGAPNGFPLLVVFTRLTAMFNWGTWTDFSGGENVNGANGEYRWDSDWLADGKWHLFTMVFEPMHSVIYVDGQAVNEWNHNDNNNLKGLFDNAGDFHHVCIGGNQAFEWNDPDPGFWYDNVALYNQALTRQQIRDIYRGRIVK